MIKSPRFAMASVFLLIVVFLVSGCGSGKKEGNSTAPSTDLANAVKLGNSNCLQCHNAGKDLTMINDLDTRTIGGVYEDSVHFNPLFNPNANGQVQCEDCHGGGQFHWGTGPLAYPVPDWTICVQCHNAAHGPDFPNEFPQTAHANTDMTPDKFFFQGGTGTTQATNRGVPETTPDGTPVTKNQHIEECSVCHDSNQRFVYDNSGNLLLPDPNNMPNPTVSCGNCHDAHQVGQIVLVPTREAGSNPQGNVVYPVFRKEQIPQKDQIVRSGPWVRPIIYQPNGAVQSDGSVDRSKVVGTNNELSVELVCAACHAQGLYKYSKQPTHQVNVYPQWLNSGHGTRNDPAFAEFSANPPAYTNPDTGQAYELGTHYSSYPLDMSLNKFGATANTTQNAGNNVYACFHCHNGLGSLVWQADLQGTPAAAVIFGDEPVTCITCHSPHSQPTGTQFSLNVPVKMTQYSTSSVTIDGNFFLDNTALPPITATENGTICIFCHQGRESGYTLYWTKLAPNKTITGSFFNPHYLGTAAMLWGRNAYEYPGKSYSFNVAHQGANCPTCHMDNPTSDNRNGGHTWWPNVDTCNTQACHGGFGPVAPDPTSENGPASPDVDNYRASFDTHNYTGQPNGESLSIANSIRVLENFLIAELAERGIYYDDLSYPYFFSDPEHTTPFTAWTPAPYKAAFNLSYTIKGLPSSNESQINQPNPSAAVHDYKYIIQLLQDSYQDLTGAALPGAFRPEGTRPATNYDPQANGGYSPNQ